MITGNDSVDASTPPIYEEIPSSYSKTPNDNKCNLELQENAAYQITRDFKFHENAAYCIVTTRNV